MCGQNKRSIGYKKKRLGTEESKNRYSNRNKFRFERFKKRKKDVKKYGPRKRNFPKSDGDGLFDILIKGAEILNKPPAKKIGGEAKIKEVAKGLHKASATHKKQANKLDSISAYQGKFIKHDSADINLSNPSSIEYYGDLLK